MRLNVEQLEDRCLCDINWISPSLPLIGPVGGVNPQGYVVTNPAMPPIPPPTVFAPATLFGVRIYGTVPVQPSPIPQLKLNLPPYPMPLADP